MKLSTSLADEKKTGSQKEKNSAEILSEFDVTGKKSERRNTDSDTDALKAAQAAPNESEVSWFWHLEQMHFETVVQTAGREAVDGRE